MVVLALSINMPRSIAEGRLINRLFENHQRGHHEGERILDQFAGLMESIRSSRRPC